MDIACVGRTSAQQCSAGGEGKITGRFMVRLLVDDARIAACLCSKRAPIPVPLTLDGYAT
jgi:hypothetical protein